MSRAPQRLLPAGGADLGGPPEEQLHRRVVVPDRRQDPRAPGAGVARAAGLFRFDADRAARAGRPEGDAARAGGEDGVVAAQAGALAGPEAGAALADDDLAA